METTTKANLNNQILTEFTTPKKSKVKTKEKTDEQLDLLTAMEKISDFAEDSGLSKNF